MAGEERDEVVQEPEDRAPIDTDRDELLDDEELDSMFSDKEIEDDDEPDAPRDEKGRFKAQANDGKAGSDAEPGDPDEDSEIEVPGVGKVAVKDIKKWEALSKREQEIEQRAQDLESQLQEASSAEEQLAVWKKLDALAGKYPKLKERFEEVLREVVESGDFGPENESGQARGFDPKAFGGKNSETEEDDPELEADLHYVRQMRMEKVASEITGLLKSVNESYPGVVKVDREGNVDREWMKDTLAPEVRRRFGDNVNLDHIRMTLNDMIVSSGALKRVKEEGAADLAKALARQPKGTVVLPPGGSKKQTVQPEPDWSKKSMDDIARSIAEDDTIFTKR